VSADISLDQVNKVENNLHDSTDKTPEEKRKILTEMVAQGGGVNIHDDKAVEWDVELAGDPNFPGREGRRQLEHKIAGFDAALKSGGDPKSVYADIEATIRSEAARYVAISDRANYTDLPGELRQKVLDQITHNLTLLKSHRGNVGAEAMAAHHDRSDPKLAAMQTEMDTLNAQIKENNHLLMRYDQAIDRAKAGQIVSTNHAMSAKISSQRATCPRPTSSGPRSTCSS